MLITKIMIDDVNYKNFDRLMLITKIMIDDVNYKNYNDRC